MSGSIGYRNTEVISRYTSASALGGVAVQFGSPNDGDTIVYNEAVNQFIFASGTLLSP
jgi:hypothetical protein